MEYDLETFLRYFPEFNSTLNVENSKYIGMFNVYLNLAKNTYSENRYFESTEFIWGLFIAHNLKLLFERSKNINNNANLNTSILTTSKKLNVGGLEQKVNKDNNEYFFSTEYGKQLYYLVKDIEKFNMIGVY